MAKSGCLSPLDYDAVKSALTEDAEDLAVFKKRSKDKPVSYEDMVKRLKKDGLI